MNEQRKGLGAGNVVRKRSGTMNEVLSAPFSFAVLGIEQLVTQHSRFSLIPLYPGQAGCQICTRERGKHGHFNISVNF